MNCNGCNNKQCIEQKNDSINNKNKNSNSSNTCSDIKEDPYISAKYLKIQKWEEEIYEKSLSSKLFVSRFLADSSKIYFVKNTNNIRISTDNTINEKVAIKTTISDDPDYMSESQILELKLLEKLSHKNIISLLGYNIEFTNDNILCHMILEYVPMSLYDSIMNYSLKSKMRKCIKNLMYQLLDVCNYLHNNNVIHKDLKPSNILINNKNIIKLIDFGLSDFKNNEKYVYDIVTVNYRAPELLLGLEYHDYSVDIWSIGCIFFSLITNETLFDGDNENDIIYSIFDQCGHPTEDTWPKASKLKFYDKYMNSNCIFPFDERLHWKNRIKCNKHCFDEYTMDLLQKLLILDPLKRISAKEALQHKYFITKYSNNK